MKFKREEWLKLLVQVQKNDKIIGSDLDLSDRHLTPPSIREVSKALLSNTTLTGLILNGNASLGDAGVTNVIDTIEKTQTITSLSMSNCGITARGLIRIYEFIRKDTKLVTLNIGNHNVTWQTAVVLLQALQQNKTLCTVHLHDMNLQDSCASEVGKLLTNNRSLSRLSLSHNKFTDTGIRTIAAALASTTLTYIDFEGIALSSLGIFYIANALKRASTVVHLNLADTGLTNASVSSLIEVVKVSQTLRTININNNQGVSADLKNKLKVYLQRSVTKPIDAYLEMIEACVKMEQLDTANLKAMCELATQVEYLHEELTIAQETIMKEEFDSQTVAKRDETRVKLAKQAEHLIRKFKQCTIAHVLARATKLAGDDIEGDSDDNDDCSLLFDKVLIDAQTTKDLKELKEWRAAIVACNETHAASLNVIVSNIQKYVQPLAVNRNEKALQSMLAELKTMASESESVANDPYPEELCNAKPEAIDNVISKFQQVYSQAKRLYHRIESTCGIEQQWLETHSSIVSLRVDDVESEAKNVRKQWKRSKTALMDAEWALRRVEHDTDSDEDVEERGNNDRVKLEKDLQQAKQNYGQISKKLDNIALKLNMLGSIHFPELQHRHKWLKTSVFKSSGGALRTRVLEEFDDVNVLSDDANHRVLQAKWQDKCVVLKEFNLKNDTDKACFMNEVKKLKSLNHPHVVQVQAVFVCARSIGVKGECGYIQMPLYVNGDLDKWLEPNASFTDAQRQSVLRTALLGLAYVHSQNIIHCDVKTKNIFVTEQMTGVLGDFDVSHDVSTRATLASAATKLSITGATWDYMAPELTNQKGTYSSDMYSFGLVIFDLHFPPEIDGDNREYCRPLWNEMLRENDEIEIPEYDNDDVNDDLRELLEQVLCRDPHSRLTAHDALAEQYFHLQLHPHRDGVAGKRECVVMYDEYWLDEGIVCGRDHFVSKDAIEGLVGSLASGGAGKHNGKVKCPGRHNDLPCDHILDSQLISTHVEPETFERFQKMQKDAFEMEAELEFKKREKAAVEAALKDKTVTEHRKYIEDQLLTLRCPVDGCGQVFIGDNIDFKQCLALKCSRDDNHNFCGWCLMDCGTSQAAHEHVRRCPLNENDGNDLWTTRALFDRCHQKRWLRLVQRYFNETKGIDKKAVKKACAAVLKAHGIETNQLK